MDFLLNNLNMLPAEIEYDYLPPPCHHCGKAPYRNNADIPEKKTARLDITKFSEHGLPKDSPFYSPAEWHIKYFMENRYYGISNESLEVCVESMLSALKKDGYIK